MTWAFPAQRRADRFEALVEELVEDASTRESHARDAHLLELVGALRGVPTVDARPECG
jgi:hypothetical protein